MEISKKLVFNGRVFKFGDNIDTDVIIPARYLTTGDPLELASHCMEDLDVDFYRKVKKGDIIVAGENFGCGSSREHAPIAIKATGISCVIARSFARIFYRNAINIGLPILESEYSLDEINEGDELEVDFSQGKIYNLNTGKHFKAQPFPDFMLEIINTGGLINWTQKKLEQDNLKGDMQCTGLL